MARGCALSGKMPSPMIWFTPPSRHHSWRTAAASGARTIDGLQMLLYQGVLAFEAWTGHRAPADVMMAQLLKGRNHS